MVHVIVALDKYGIIVLSVVTYDAQESDDGLLLLVGRDWLVRTLPLTQLLAMSNIMMLCWLALVWFPSAAVDHLLVLFRKSWSFPKCFCTVAVKLVVARSVQNSRLQQYLY